MISFLTFFGEILSHLMQLLLNSAIGNVLGAPLFWLLFTFFICWTCCQMFVFRQSVSPGASKIISDSVNGGNKK